MKWTKPVIVALVGASVMLTIAGCGRGTFATVGGEKISKDEFYKRLENLPVSGRPAGTIVLDQMINERLIMQLAKKMNVPPTDAQVEKRLSAAKKDGNLAKILQARNITVDEFKTELKAQQAYFNVVTKGVDVNEADVQKYYNQAKSTVFTTPERVKVAGIICKSRQNIDKAAGQLTKGTDFTSVVLNLSEDEMSRKGRTPGELGWVWKGQKNVPVNLIDIAFTLKKGDTSQPFQVLVNGKPSDWVIVRCMDHEPKKVKSYGEVKDQIRDAIAFTKGQQSGKIAKMLQDMRADAKIKINSEKYKMQVPETSKKDKKG